jgi:gluconate kinase
MADSKETWEDQIADDEINSETSEQRDGIVTSSVLCEKWRSQLYRNNSVANVLAFDFRQSTVTEYSY